MAKTVNDTSSATRAGLESATRGGLRPAIGAALLALLLSTASAGAFAAPAAPSERQNMRPEASAGLETLPREIAGVVGSGDKLQLRLRAADGQARTLSIGDEYKAGWTLKGLTSAVATFSQGNQLRQIGLNPDGVVAAGDADGKSSVTVLGVLTPDQMAALQEEVRSGRWDGNPAWGMSQDETNRLIVYDQQRDQAYLDWYSKNWVAGKMAGEIPGRPAEADILGGDNDDYQKLAATRNAYRTSTYAADMAQAGTGPTTLYVPADQIPVRVATAAGADPNGVWTLGPADANGGRTMVQVPSDRYVPAVLTSAIPAANRGTPR